MRIIRSASAVAHYKTPLVVRASLPRTFWSLGAFVELGLIFCGVYLLAEASLKPLEADQASIISAGVILALASVLLFYMIRPRRKQALRRPEASCRSHDQSDELPFRAYGNAVPAHREAEQALQKKQDLPGPM
ncbi:MAG TPA: hypothetical protein VJY15_03265 [Candidatus Acidoferrum sp.]|nr:hypothetical protein [Candidatus Acidoferrum sp.]